MIDRPSGGNLIAIYGERLGGVRVFHADIIHTLRLRLKLLVAAADGPFRARRRGFPSLVLRASKQWGPDAQWR
jgi:hypothetical protein